MTTDLLQQTYGWVDRQGRIHSLEDIDRRYAITIIRFLANRAPILRRKAIENFLLGLYSESGVSLMGDFAQDSLDREYDELICAVPWEWLARQPLMKALQEKVRGS